MKLETRQIMFGVILTMPFSCYLFNQWLVTDETEKRGGQCLCSTINTIRLYHTIFYPGVCNFVVTTQFLLVIRSRMLWHRKNETGILGKEWILMPSIYTVTRIMNLYDQFKLSIVMALFRVICWALVFILHDCCNTSSRRVSFNRIHREEKSNQL